MKEKNVPAALTPLSPLRRPAQPPSPAVSRGYGWTGGKQLNNFLLFLSIFVE
jgi:hypothetical protein